MSWNIQKVRTVVSVSAIVLGGIGLLFVGPMCDCPEYYIAVSAISLFPLVVGPKVYRFIGVGMLVGGLFLAYWQFKHRAFMDDQLEQMRRESQRLEEAGRHQGQQATPTPN